jgi:hypothetical protein
VNDTGGRNNVPMYFVALRVKDRGECMSELDMIWSWNQ